MSLSTFLNAGTATQLRGLAWLALSDSGSVLALSITDDGGGGGTASWAAGPAVPCRVDPLTARSRVTGGAIDERSTHVVTVPAGVSVSASGRFAITGRGTFEVTAVRSRTAELTHTFEVISIN